MRETFIERGFSLSNEMLINTINSILDEYRRQDFRLSLRQLYYQLVARDFIANTQRSYKNTGNLVSNARLAGLIDWDMIEDRNRETNSPSHWNSPAEIVRVAASSFRIDKWFNQEYHIEVMVEKDALSGVLDPICHELDISITANKGYCSSSTMYEIGKRLYRKSFGEKKAICVIYLGDHDPSGIDMTRDVQDRLGMYSYIRNIEVIRVALNWDQIEQWRPPENPAKETDSRYSSYLEKFGDSSWELDAVEPSQLSELVQSIVLERRDELAWQEAIDKEDDMRRDLNAFAETYGGNE